MAFGGLLEGSRFGQPGGGDVISKGRELGCQRLVRPPVLLGEELDELVSGAPGASAQQQVAAVSSWQEVVRVPAHQWEVQLEQGQQLRRHQPEQVGPRRDAEPRRPREGHLRPAGATDHRRPLQDLHGQTGAGEQGGSDQPVVPGPDHDHVLHCPPAHCFRLAA